MRVTNPYDNGRGGRGQSDSHSIKCPWIRLDDKQLQGVEKGRVMLVPSEGPLVVAVERTTDSPSLEFLWFASTSTFCGLLEHNKKVYCLTN